MNKFRMMSIFVLLAMLFSFANVSPAAAAPLAETAPITTVPTELCIGDQYRLVFVTDGIISSGQYRNQTLWSNIETYNDFVTTQANSVPELSQLGTTWKVIGSTVYVEARVNTGTHPSTPGVPIYSVADKLIAASNTDLWDGAIANAIDITQSGVLLPVGTRIITGSTYFGTRFWNGRYGWGTFGSDGVAGRGIRIAFGLSGNIDHAWIDNATYPFSARVYAMSGILTVPATAVEGDGCNSPPSANAGGPYYGAEGFSIALDGSASNDPDGNPLTYNWTVSDPVVCTFDDPTSSNPNLTCIDNGDFPTQISVNDGTASDSDDTVVYVQNLPPEADLANNGPIYEGDTALVSFSNASDYSSADTAAGFHYAFDCNGGSLAAATYAGSGTSDGTACAFADNGSFPVTGRIMDKDDGFDEWDTTVEVNNVAPTLGALTVDLALVEVNTNIIASAVFTDPGALDTHTATWDWGDGTTAGTVTQGAGSGSVNDSHSYSVPGVYTVKLTVTDNDGDASNESIYEFVVVYDPSGGFVTGGGWIDSPSGAYKADLSLTGKANFGFVAKYKKGANVPDGNTQFQFKAGDLNFHSSSYEWLVVAGTNAQFKGEGTINGQGSYRFMIWADDDNPDTFRIQIWGDNGVVYDNGSQQSLGGGSIKIHN
jgi:hypothetical protein